MARVFLARSARDALAELDLLRAEAVLDALGELERDPDAGYEVRGRLSGLWSYRVGVYRSSTNVEIPRRSESSPSATVDRRTRPTDASD